MMLATITMLSSLTPNIPTPPPPPQSRQNQRKPQWPSGKRTIGNNNTGMSVFVQDNPLGHTDYSLLILNLLFAKNTTNKLLEGTEPRQEAGIQKSFSEKVIGFHSACVHLPAQHLPGTHGLHWRPTLASTGRDVVLSNIANLASMYLP